MRGDTAGFPFWRYQPYFSVPDEPFPDFSAVNGEDLGHDYLQDPRHFAGVEPLIREYFKPRAEIWDGLAKRFREVLALPHRTSLHVRRGDYLRHPNFHQPLPLVYYEEAMTLTRPPYLVFSDDLEWCRANLRGDCLYVEHNRDFEDLFLMATCHEHITANSTFSWWGAWLANNRAVYPRHSWGPDLTHLDPMVMIPPGAIVLEGVKMDSRG